MSDHLQLPLRTSCYHTLTQTNSHFNQRELKPHITTTEPPTMGGNAFLTPSHRLTTPQLDALLTYTQTKLSPLVPGPIEPTRCFKSKSSHGDLDVQVGCYTAGPGWKANASSGPDTATICPPSSQRGSWKKLSNTDGAVWSAEDTKVFLDELAMALRAKRWLRHGDAASFAVPCGVLGGLAGHYLAGEVGQYPSSTFTSCIKSSILLCQFSIPDTQRAVYMLGQSTFAIIITIPISSLVD